MAVAGAVSVDEFVAAVLRFGRDGFAPDAMMRLLSETRLRESEMAPYIREDAGGEYTRILVHRTPDVEILALTWPQGSATPIHDHAQQKCWMVAHEGVFVVEDFRQVAGTRAPGHAVVECTKTTPNITIGMPDYRFETDRDIHRVSVAPGCRRAVSLQVYARPYTSCLVFDEAARTARELRVDCVSPF